jgi:C1A family cysteine protease
MRSSLRAWLLVAVALTSCGALSGGLPSAGAAAASSAPPWETAGPYPTAFDLRTQQRVTPVRSQDGFSTCWIMSAMGSLESALITSEGVAHDFSENNLANHMSSRLVYEGRAPSELAAAYFARWEGPVFERSDPYPDRGGSPTFLRAVRHVQDVLFLPQRGDPLDNDAVKWAVTTYGGVDAAMDFRAGETSFWKPATNSYYGLQDDVLNHHVLCVGWDDAYPKSSFASTPPGDGAFLIKNSWGTDWGDAGYFWLSYYDASFGDALAVFGGAEGVGNYDAIYQYDALGRSGWVDARGRGAGSTPGVESAWYASRFTCAGGGSVEAVSFYTPVPGAGYEVRIAGSLGGIAGASVAGSGTVAVGGYHTVRLDQPVTVTTGRTFVAAVRVTTPGWTYPVPVERPSDLIDPRARAGQSYLSADGVTWADLTTLAGLSRGNVCLKAFVDAAGSGDTRPPQVDLAGGVVAPGATARVRWRLRDPAFSSASAILVLTVRDAKGRVMARRRLPAVAVGERGVWSLSRSWPRGRFSVRGLAYDAAGRRQAVATRATIIVRSSAAAVEGRR